MIDAAGLVELMGDRDALWAGLPAAAKADFVAHLEPVLLPGGQELFRQGEPGDALYMLASGLVGISVEDGKGGRRHLARIAPPETIGEMALLSNAPRSATVVALRDSLLVRLSRPSFEALVERWPGSMSNLGRALADRLRARNEAPRAAAASNTVAVVPATAGASAQHLAARLAVALRGRGRRKVLVLTGPPDGADEAWYHRTEAAHDHVVYSSASAGGEWGRFCLRRADQVVALALPGEPVLDGPLLEGQPASDWRRRDLVLLQRPGARRPAPPHPSLDRLAFEFRLHLHDDGRDLARLARMITGRALGVVFSGGGARGFAHIGVVQALAEAGVAIDLVGGTSIGAVMAACVAAGWSPQELRERLRQAFVAGRPMSDYTYPAVALLAGRKVRALLEAAFGDRAIEDLWLPYFCVSSNLTTGHAHLHRSGPLAPALRASIAIPGLLPPLVDPEGVLADGALMNNLPADVMAEWKRGPVMGIDVARDLALPPVTSPSLLRRLFGIDGRAPALASILLRAATMASDAQVAHTRAHAAWLLQPPLASIGLRSWASFDQAVEIGYRHACEYLAAHPDALRVEPAAGAAVTPPPGGTPPAGAAS